MRIYKEAFAKGRSSGFTYSFELPDGWTTGREDDGERWFIVHRSAENSPLQLKVTSTAGASTNWKPHGLPKGLTDPGLRLAYTLAEMDACLRASGIFLWFIRYLAHGLGWHPRLMDETLGKSRGFTHSRGIGNVPGWFGCFVQPPCLFWVDFRPAGKDLAAEIAVARNIVASFKLSRS